MSEGDKGPGPDLVDQEIEHAAPGDSTNSETVVGTGARARARAPRDVGPAAVEAEAAGADGTGQDAVGAEGTAPGGTGTLVMGSVAAPESVTSSDTTSPFRTETSGLLLPPGPGVQINQYELIRELGQGGMGTVFLARDMKLGRRVAIKFLQRTTPELSHRFLIEARATARCNHENIVVIYEVGEHMETPFMVLEYVQGQPLQKLIDGGQTLPPGRAVEIILSVVRALVVAHAEGIVHRDLKPDNVVVTDQGTVKVLDFGIARVVQEKAREELEAGRTHAGAIIGTVPYMSPEQWGIGVEIDHQTDLWAIGIMLYCMVVGKHPLHPLVGQQMVVTAMLEQPMPSIREAMPDLSGDLADVVDGCLRKVKEERFATAKDLLRALEKARPSSAGVRGITADESPYAGLAPFQEQDAQKFFGRNREIAAMVNKIRTQPILGVVGSSGVGKSSLVRAGVVPALKSSGETWECLTMRPGRHPLAALASIMQPLTTTIDSTVADEVQRQSEMIEQLKSSPGYLGTALRARAVEGNARLLLFIDQFEELYTNVADAEERAEFTRCLIGAADDATSPVRIVISIRGDFLDRVAENPAFLEELTQGLFFLLPPNREAMREALTHPAELVGYTFEDGAMVEDMLDHVASSPGALPLLQFTASKLWEGRDKARCQLTAASYESMGGIGGALASHADNVLTRLAPHAQSTARSLFLRLVTPERTRAVVSIKELYDERDAAEVHQVIEQLAYARLIVVQGAQGKGNSTVEIVHESLISGWPTLQRWLDAGHEDVLFMEQLRQASRQWQGKGRAPGLLWRGEIVHEARRFRKRFGGPLPDVQERFLREVFATQDKRKRLRRLAFIGSMVFLAALTAAAVVALVVINRARHQANTALKEAKKSEQVAVTARDQAEANLKKMIEAQNATNVAQRKTTKAEAKVARTNEELELANAELTSAVEVAEAEKKKAEREEKKAAEAWKKAQEEADRAKRAQEKVEVLLSRERARAKKLEKQLGSKMIEDLD